MASFADTLNPASAILGGIEGGVQLIDNIIKEGKTKKELESLQRPFYKIQDEYLQNRNFSAAMAQGGNPAAENDYLTGESQRGLSAGISGTLQSGGNPNDINRLFQSYNNNIDRTYADSAAQHLKNIQYYMEANKDVAGQKNIQFGVNELQPYQNKLAQLTGNSNAQQQNAYAGANTLIGSTSALGTSLENNALLKKLFGTTTTDSGLSNKTQAVAGNIPNYATPSIPDPFEPIATNEAPVDTAGIENFFNRQIKY